MTRSRSLFAAIVVAAMVAACGGTSGQRDALEAQAGVDDETLAKLASLLSEDGAAVTPEAEEAPAEEGAAPAPEALPDPAAAAAPAPTSAASPAPAAPKPAAKPAARSSAAAAAPKPSTPGASASGPAPSGGQPSSGQAAAPAPGQPAPAPGQAAAPAPAPSGAPAKGGATDTGVEANSVKVGHIGIYSGPVGSFGDDLSHACRAGLQAINDEGGAAGRKLNVEVRDDGWDATKGSNAVRDLVEREKVFGLACSMSVPTNDAITPYMDQQKVPNVGGDGWGEAQYAGAWSFPVGASGVNQAENLAEYQTKQQGAKKVGVLYWNNTTGKAYLDAYKKVVEENGAKVVVSQAANFDDPGTSTFIAQARANDVDTITTQIDPGIFARMVREAAAQGYKPKNGYSGSAALYFQATPGLTGPSAEGTVAAIDWTPDDPEGPSKASPGFSAYKETVERYYPNIDHSNWTKAGYVGAKVFGDALKRLGVNLTRQGLKDDLDRLSDFDTGLGPKITFRPGQHRANKTTYLVQLKKNEESNLVWRHIAGPIDNPRRGKN